LLCKLILKVIAMSPQMLARRYDCLTGYHGSITTPRDYANLPGNMNAQQT
jgi:hypothetical protein